MTLLAVFFSSLAVVGVKLSADYFPIGVILFYQYLVALLFNLPRLLRQGPRVVRTARPGLHLFRALCGLASFYAFYQAVSNISLLEATLLRSSAPLWVPVLVVGVLRLRVSSAVWLPLIVGLGGVALILDPSFDQLRRWHLFGLAAGITLAGSMISTRYLLKTESRYSIVFYYFLVSVLCTAPGAVTIPVEATPLYWGLVVLIGFFLHLAMQCFTWAYQYAKPSELGPFSYFGVVFSGAWGWLIWGTIPTWQTLIGVAMVIAAGLFLVWCETARRR